VRWAAAGRIPLTPVSSPAGPRFRGDTIPRDDALVVDLSEMNRVLHVDRRDKVAMIEPGVTFPELERALAPHGLSPYLPLAPRVGKSVLTAYLEREPVLVVREHWDASDPLVCTEIVFGTGEVFRTGSAAGPGSVEQQIREGVRQLNPAGPGTTSLARVVQGAQGTIGIVTWATINCRVTPFCSQAHRVPASSLVPLIELAYASTRRRLGEELFLMNAALNAVLSARGDAPGSADLPPWTLAIRLAGYARLGEERIAYQREDLHDLGATLGLRAHCDEGLNAALAHAFGPRADPVELQRGGGCQELMFLTTLDRVPAHLETAFAALTTAGIGRDDVGVYLQPITQGCACHCELMVFHRPGDARDAERLKRILRKACMDLIAAGAHFSRPYEPWRDIPFAADPAYTALLSKVRGVFDPHRIMNPGKLAG
jgi:FAD/FMN-containing dehydrogenase